MNAPAAINLFSILIDEAHRTMRGASMLPRVAELEELEALVLGAYRTPVDGPRLVFDVETTLAQMLVRIEQARADKEPRRERLWLQIAGVLLPEVKDHAHDALLMQTRGPSTSDQDYAGRK